MENLNVFKIACVTIISLMSFLHISTIFQVFKGAIKEGVVDYKKLKSDILYVFRPYFYMLIGSVGYFIVFTIDVTFFRYIFLANAIVNFLPILIYIFCVVRENE